jgi:hypothetical protein
MCDTILIDDTQSALAHLTPFGREIVTPIAGQVQRTMVLAAGLRGWRIIEHGRFVEWAEDQVDQDYLWLVLDPLLHPERLGVEAIPLHLSRKLSNGILTINSSLADDLARRVRGREVGLIDDAAWSGQTLLYASELVAAAGGIVSDVVVAAAGAEARARLHASVSWVQYYRGSCTVMHLRDACPLFPYSGRRLAGADVQSGGTRLEGAVSMLASRNGPWADIARDNFAARELRAAWARGFAKMSSILDRQPLVSDLPRLGSAVRVPLHRSTEYSPETPLSMLI